MSTNPYYNPKPMQPATVASAEAVNSELQKIRDAFLKLPDPTAIPTGGGQANYTHIAYADSADGTANFSFEAGSREYIGFSPNQPTPELSENPEDYRWARLRGFDGTYEINDFSDDSIDLDLDGVGRFVFNIGDNLVVIAEVTAEDISSGLTPSIQALETSVSALELSLGALDIRVDGLVGTVNTVAADANARVDALANDLVAQTDAIDTLIQSEVDARVDGDQALVDTIDLIGAVSGDGLAFVADLTTLKVSPTESFAERFTAIASQAATTAASVTSEASARADADSALSTRIDVLQATAGTGNVTFRQSTAPTGANAGDIWYDTSDGDKPYRFDGTSWVEITDERLLSNAAAIVSEATARADADSAQATQINGLTAQVNVLDTNVTTNAAAIVSEADARADDVSALASRIDGLQASSGTGNRVFRSTVSPANPIAGDVWIDSGNGNLIYIFDGADFVPVPDLRIAANEAAILSEQTARANADSAQATQITGLTAQVTQIADDVIQNTALIGTESTARADADTAQANQLTTLQAEVATLTQNTATNAAEISTEASVRANADTAQANNITVLTAEVAAAADAAINNAALIASESSTRASSISALASQISTLQADVATNSAEISSESDARASADGAQASQISALTSRVGTAEASVIAVSSTVDGVSARTGLLTNVNGHVQGTIQNNGGAGNSEFVVISEKFGVVSELDPDADPDFIFEVTDSGVRINGDLIVNGSILTDQIAAGAITKSESRFLSGAITVTNSGTEVISDSITTTGGDVHLHFGCHYFQANNSGLVPIDVAYTIKRGSMTIRTGTYTQVPGVVPATVTAFGNPNDVLGQVEVPQTVSNTGHLFVIDKTAPAGAHTYRVDLQCLTGSGTARSRQIGLLETKR